MKLREVTVALTGVLLFVLLAASPAFASARNHRVSTDPRHSFGRGTSTNWSGYAVTGTDARQVTGTWTQPTVRCAPGENSWSSPWVGIDGDNSNTVEQIGTDSDCQNGKPVYYAWYEMYPKSLVTVNMPVRAGDSFTGKVSYDSSGFHLTLTNNTVSPNAPFSTTQGSKRARRTSVEWIMEGPSSGLLSNFGSVSFSGATASINGTQNGNLGSFANRDPITMVTNQGTPRAVPSGISGGTSFSVSWKQA